MDEEGGRLAVADYVVFALMLVVSTAIGLFYVIKDRKKQNTNEYLLGGRSMSAYPVAISLCLSFMSAILFLGIPADVYRHGSVNFWFALSFILACVITSEIYIPTFYKANITSVYEYLEKRFNRVIRIEGTIVFIIQTVLFSGVIIYGPALVLNAVTGLNLWAAAISTAIICIIYSSLGGLKAVVWTDVIQAIVVLMVLLSILIQGSLVLGGFGEIWKRNEEGGRLRFFRFDPDLREIQTTLKQLVGATFLFLPFFAVNQGQIQRYLACGTVREARKSIILSAIGLAILFILSLLCGFVLYAYFKDCDPMSLGVVKHPDQLLPYMVVGIFQRNPGLAGLFIAGVFSATLSNVSTAITALASVTIEDFLKPAFNWKETTFAWVSRGLVTFYGLLIILVAYLASTLDSILHAAVSMLGLVGGQLLGTYTLGMMFKFANNIGTLVGLNVGLAVNIWIFIGGKIYPRPLKFFGRLPVSTSGCPDAHDLNSSWPINTTSAVTEFITSTSTTAASTPLPTQVEELNPILSQLYHMSPWLYPVFGFFLTVIVGLIVSALTCGHRKQKDVNPDLIYHFFDHWIFTCCHALVDKNKDNDGRTKHQEIKDATKEEVYQIEDEEKEKNNKEDIEGKDTANQAINVDPV